MLKRIAFFVLLSPVIWGQEILWDKTIGGNRRDVANDIIENHIGELVVVGTTQSKAKRGKDILFRILDQNYQGITLQERNIGQRGDDSGQALIQMPDGAYLIAGSTDSPWAHGSYGESDAWLVKIDEFGDIIQDTVMGTPDQDAFLDVNQHDDSFYGVGYLSDYAYVMQIDAQLNGTNKFIYNQKNTKYTSSIVSDEYLVVAGTRQSGQRGSAILSLFDDDLNPIWHYKSKGVDIVGVSDVIAYKDEYIILAQAQDRRKRTESLLICVDKSGKKSTTHQIGGYDHDYGQKIAIIQDSIWVVGSTYSHTRGARRTDAWIYPFGSISEKEKQDKTPSFHGGKMTDGINSLSQLHNGSVVYAGYTGSKLDVNQDAWILKDKLNYESIDSISGIQIDDISFYEANHNDTLNHNERGYITLSLYNPDTVTARGLSCYTARSVTTSGMNIDKTLLIPDIPARSGVKAYVPIKSSEYVLSHDNTINLQIIQKGYNNVLARQSLEVISKAKPVPVIHISEVRYDTLHQDTLYQRREAITISFRVQNIGEGIAEEAFARIALPYKVDPYADGAYDQPLGRLYPHEDTVVQFMIYASSIYEFDKILVGCTAYESDQWSIDRETIEIPLINFYKDGFDTPPEYDAKQRSLHDQIFEKERGGPSPSDGYEAIEYITDVEWYAPDPFDYGYEFDLQVDYINVQLNIASPDLFLTNDNVTLYINDQRAIEGKDYKSGEERINVGPKGKRFRYVNEIKLREGANEFYVEIDDKGQKRKSETLKINCVLLKPDLFLYAVGIPHDDLSFTTKDASDFASIFDQNRHFDQTHIKVLNDSISTSSIAIRDMMDELVESIIKAQDKQMANGEKNKKNVVMLYLSSHGFVKKRRSNDDFRIACSDFDYRRSGRSIDFDADILANLEYLDSSVTSLVFIDACQSGTIANLELGFDEESLDNVDISDAAIEIASGFSSIYSLVSCGPGELSYEDPEWANGAFTKAIKEAFSNELIMTDTGISSTDIDEDQKISVAELYRYLNIRVPELVKGKRPKAQTTQTPFMPPAAAKSSFTLYDLRDE